MKFRQVRGDSYYPRDLAGLKSKDILEKKLSYVEDKCK
jgi:hypothetical protein